MPRSFLRENFWSFTIHGTPHQPTNRQNSTKASSALSHAIEILLIEVLRECQRTSSNKNCMFGNANIAEHTVLIGRGGQWSSYNVCREVDRWLFGAFGCSAACG